MRLRRSDPSSSGLRRRRRGSGFSYHQPDGSRVSPQDRERIHALAIPPAWRDVWICPWPNGHIQAMGTDDAGRRQYLYHQEWRRQRDEEKYDRVLELASRLPRFRREIDRQLTGRGWPRTRTLAVALRMLDHGVFRTGGEEYAETNGTYGVATVLREHVRINADRITFHYLAKGGIEQSLTLSDRELARAVAGLRRAAAAAIATRCIPCGEGSSAGGFRTPGQHAVGGPQVLHRPSSLRSVRGWYDDRSEACAARLGGAADGPDPGRGGPCGTGSALRLIIRTWGRRIRIAVVAGLRNDPDCATSDAAGRRSTGLRWPETARPR